MASIVLPRMTDGWQVLPPARRPASVGEALVYAIGDIHGRYDLLRALLALIAEDARTQARGRQPCLVLCGDYIDRGPASAETLEAILWLERHGTYRLHALRGNHEQSLLDFIERPESGAGWLRFGGEETLRSYGAAVPGADATPEDLVHARDELMDRMPAAHHRLLLRLPLTAEIGDYLFVHAGIRPGRQVAAQDAKDLLWIRGDFLDHRGPLPKIVVHGHSWEDAAPQIGDYRIGIDTGAYATDVLTALRLDGTGRAFVQAGAE